MKKLNLFIVLFLVTALQQLGAALRLPQLFQDGMVMQRGTEVPVWGWATAGDEVTVVLKKKAYRATADHDGRWTVKLPAQKAGGPYTILIKSGDEERVLQDVLFGDVWLCSGQSNIDVTIERVYPQYGKVIDDYSNEKIRMFRVQTDTDIHGPKDDVKPTPIHWSKVTKQNAWLFSAVGYFLAREMNAKTGVPQGVIVNSLGGTPIQAWLPADTIQRYLPADFNRLQYYQDDAMTRAFQQANGRASSRWQQLMDQNDAGLGEGYIQPDYDDSGWAQHPQFQPLTRGPYHGSYWARLHVNVDAGHAGQPARLLLGTLYDADFTYLNGQQVGHTGYQYPPRRYDVPAGVLKEGDNVIAVRFITKGGAPHFIKAKPYKFVFTDSSEIALPDAWRIHEGARMPRMPQIDVNIQNFPSVLYNAMLHPLAPYALSGVVWYQGESNIGDAATYEQMLTQLIGTWRHAWQRADLPVVVVQLANFMEPSDKPQNSGWSQLREAQRQTTLKVPHTALACIIDLGETVDIHPLRKQEVAQRVARGFDRLLWNPKTTLSPQPAEATVQGDCVTLTLDQPLRTDGALCEFELAGADRRFVTAEATAQGSTVTIRSSVAAPCYVRYAWKENPLKANAYGTNGLPLVPFETKVETR